MTDTLTAEQLLAELRDPNTSEFTNLQLVIMAADALASATARAADAEAKLVEIAGTLDTGFVNLAGVDDPDISQFGLVVPVEDIRDTLTGGDTPITNVFTRGFHDVLDQRNTAYGILQKVKEAFSLQPQVPDSDDPDVIRGAAELHVLWQELEIAGALDLYDALEGSQTPGTGHRASEFEWGVQLDGRVDRFGTGPENEKYARRAAARQNRPVVRRLITRWDETPPVETAP